MAAVCKAIVPARRLTQPPGAPSQLILSAAFEGDAVGAEKLLNMST